MRLKVNSFPRSLLPRDSLKPQPLHQIVEEQPVPAPAELAEDQIQPRALEELSMKQA